MSVTVDSLKIEGVVLCNSSGWTAALYECNDVHLDNLKIFGHRAIPMV